MKQFWLLGPLCLSSGILFSKLLFLQDLIFRLCGQTGMLPPVRSGSFRGHQDHRLGDLNWRHLWPLWIPGTSGCWEGRFFQPCVKVSVARPCLNLWPLHGLQPARLLCPWDSSHKNTGVGCHFLPQYSSRGKIYLLLVFLIIAIQDFYPWFRKVFLSFFLERSDTTE